MKNRFIFIFVLLLILVFVVPKTGETVSQNSAQDIISSIVNRLNSLIRQLNTLSPIEISREIDAIKSDIVAVQQMILSGTAVTPTPGTYSVSGAVPTYTAVSGCSTTVDCKSNTNPNESCEMVTVEGSTNTYCPTGCHSDVQTVCPTDNPTCEAMRYQEQSCFQTFHEITNPDGSIDTSNMPTSPAEATPGTPWVAPAYRIIVTGQPGQIIPGQYDVWCAYSNQSEAIHCGMGASGSYCLPNWNPPGCVNY